MDAAISIVNTTIPVFLIILIGFTIGKLQKGAGIQPVIDWLVFITSPCLFISNLSRTEVNLSDFSMTFLSALLIMGLQALLVFIILRITKSAKTGLFLPLSIGNTGYLGFPIMLFAFGQAGLSNAIIYDIGSTLCIFTLGVYILHHKHDIREIFRIPVIYSVIAGLLLGYFRVELPDLIFKPIQMIGNITIPLALIVLGYQLPRIKLSMIKTSAACSLFRIFAGFALAMLVVSIFDIGGVPRDVILLEASMPSAVMSMILTQKYEKDAELTASIVLITTLMGIITIPLILFFTTL